MTINQTINFERDWKWLLETGRVELEIQPGMFDLAASNGEINICATLKEKEGTDGYRKKYQTI